MASQAGTLPDEYERVIVRCPAFNCLGFIDPKSIWHSAYSGEELTGVVGWRKIDDEEFILVKEHRATD